MNHKFVNPTQNGKNILMLRYIILFLFICLFHFLWRPIWLEYFLGNPLCEQNAWNAVYYIFVISLPLIMGLFLLIKLYQVIKCKQYPLPNALVFKPKQIIEGNDLKLHIKIQAILIFFLFVLSGLGLHIIQEKEIFKDTCEITLFN